MSDRQLLEKMLEIQSHRGPDSRGIYQGANVALGTDRLKIIDLERGEQPIHNEDESIWITYNGEVYNYVELRSELLEKGHKFYTMTDTETVVHAYEEWGEACLERFRGMYAFALWDGNRKILFAARDRFGKKPFYYALVGGAFLFSSEMKGILEYDQIPRRMSRKALDHFLTYFYIPSPLTIFEGICKLPPANYLLFDGKDFQVRQYWDMRFAPVERTEDEMTDELYRILSEAVRIRLRSDVPLGAFLSGGIDSSAVAALMSRVAGEPIRTVTVGFEEDDEHVKFGRVVAEELGSIHKERVINPNSLEILPKLVWHFDEPFADSSMIPTYYLSEATRKEVTVALTGDGGDEMFMGYPFLKDQMIFKPFRALPGPVRQAGLHAIRSWPQDRQVRKMAQQALEKHYGEQDFLGRYALRMVVFTPDTLRELYSTDALKSSAPNDTIGYMTSLLNVYSSQDEMNAVNYATFRGYLSELILTKVDRMSMAVSLEARCPLLDHVLAEYVGTIPSRYKYRGGTTKYIFKRMALKRNLLPASVVSRKKVGFGPPVDRWLGREWKDFSAQAMEKAAKTGLFSTGYLDRLLRDRYLNSTKIFGLTVFTLWYSQYMERETKSPLALNRLL